MIYLYYSTNFLNYLYLFKYYLYTYRCIKVESNDLQKNVDLIMEE